ncbi:MAG: DHH family phosphoesterase [Bacteroidales bacterium]|nr:DHH family phosphoesterase [Bacteroidales bacterium]HOI31168.1 DHH family phosphoesterase [Bacteroidales bacterium]
MNRSLFLDAFLKILEIPHKLVLTIHTNPDGDAVGSALALAAFLRVHNQEVTIVSPNKFPEFLSWLKGADHILIFDQQAKEVKARLQTADYVFCLDYNGVSRSGALQEDLLKLNCPLVLIDHHREPETDSFKLMYSNISVSSTAEMIYELIAETDVEQLKNQEIAEALFAGIMTDTGSFSHSINRAETFNAVARLIENGLDAVHVHQQIYDTFSENRLRLLGYSISNRMQVFNEFSTAVITLSKDDLNRFNFQIGDTEGIVNYPLSIHNIMMSVLITEKSDQIRFSFRSKGNFSVHELAKNHFNGGGHNNAAGGNLKLSFKEAIDYLIKVLPFYKNQLNS